MSTWAILDLMIYVWIFLIVIVGIGAMIAIFVMRGAYKHYYLRLDLTSSKAIGFLDRARIVKEHDGTSYWKLLKAKHKINRPPSEAIVPLADGKYFVRAFDLGNMNYKYSPEEIDEKTYAQVREIERRIHKDIEKTFFTKVSDHLLQLKRKSFLQLITVKPTPIIIFPAEVYTKEFTKDLTKDIIKADERQNAYNQIKKAYEKKVKGWAEWGMPVVVITGLVIMVSVMFIFGENLVRPIAEMQGVTAKTAEMNRQTQEQLTEMMRYVTLVVEDKQLGQSEIGGTVQLLNRTAPD